MKQLFPTVDDSDLAGIAAATPQEVLRARTQWGDVVLRGPTRGEWKRFQAEVLDERKRINAGENLLRACTVRPTVAELDAALDQLPGLASTLVDPVLKLAGSNAEVDLGK